MACICTYESGYSHASQLGRRVEDAGTKYFVRTGEKRLKAVRLDIAVAQVTAREKKNNSSQRLAKNCSKDAIFSAENCQAQKRRERGRAKVLSLTVF